MRHLLSFIASLAVLLVLSAARPASAEPLAVKVVVSPKEQIRVDLPTPEKHFLVLVKREGKAAGTGPLDGAQVTDYSMHDIRAGQDGTARGYLVARGPGGEAVLQWEVQATFVPGPDGKPRLLDNGFWRFVGGTGSLAGYRGAGVLHLRPSGAADREFELTGELTPVKP